MQGGPFLFDNALLEEAARFSSTSPLLMFSVGDLGASSFSLDVSNVSLDGRRSAGPRVPEEGCGEELFGS